YMPPEQASGAKHEIGPHSDVWGLGATLYTLLCGQPPFSGASVVNIISKVLAEEPPAPRSIVASIDPTLEAIVLKCLEKPLDERYRTASELVADLEAFLGPHGEGVQAKRRSAFARWVGRNRLLVAVSLLGCAGVAAATALVLQGGPAAPTPTPTPVASAATPTPQPSATPTAKQTRLVVDAQTFSDLERLPGLRVEEAISLHLSPQGLRLRGYDGYGPKLVLPLHYRWGPLRVRAKLAIHYMGIEGVISLQLRKPPEGKADLPRRSNRGPGVSELTFKGRAHEGEVQWGARFSSDKSQIELGWRSEGARDEEVELELAYDGEGHLSASLDGAPVRIEAGLASGDYEVWLVVGLGSTGQPFPYPRFSDVLLKTLEVSGEDSGLKEREDEESDYARIGRAGRAQRAGAQAASLEKELKELSLATSGLVRNRAVLLIAEGLATSGQGEESAEAFAGYYGVNVHTSLDRKRLRGTAAARGFQTWRAFPTLSQPAQRALVQGHLSFFGVSEDVAALRAEVKRFLPNSATPAALRDLHAFEALTCLLRLQQLKAEVDPLQLGLAWLYCGDPEEAYRCLSEAAQVEGPNQVNALRVAGLAAYFTRRFVEADQLWKEVEARQPGAFPAKGAWAFRRARAQRNAQR
ncbi:MAG TPA: hypothetical protein DEA08_27545, partial [Planctomycetes bacterium]|nr:hypothetical protein [Planctomycetota bacterium]